MTINPTSASSAKQAYDYIRGQVFNGTYAEGERITEQQFSDLLGLSRTPVREAMRRLVAEGLLQFQPNSGTFVRSWEPHEIAAVYDARILVESAMAGIAARNMTPAIVEEFRMLAREIELHGPDISEPNLARISPLNRAFHNLITKTAASPRFEMLQKHAVEVQIIQRTRRRYSSEQLARSFHHHNELVDAFSCRDAEWARCAMACHLRSAKFAMMGVVDEP